MLYKINCKADIAEQDASYPTYKYIDCDLHINANDANFYGRLIDCTLVIVTTLVTACKNWNQGIRTTVTINDVDVTDALVGAINIQHNKNMISTFSLSLKDTTYSPLDSTDIVPNKVVVITSYLNGHEAKLFKGLIDNTSVDYTLEGFRINVNGSGYGKKLRNKRATLVSIQDSADTNYRGALIKYLAEQADISTVDAPLGSYTRIDHSFEDQSILDMITKELMIDTYWWRFDEEAILKIALDEIKTNTTTYPTPDWTYGENRFLRLGLITSDEDIINTIRILGTVYESRIEVDNPEDSPSGSYIDSSLESTLFGRYKSLAEGVSILGWTATEGDWSLEVWNGYRNVYGGVSQTTYGNYRYYTIIVEGDGLYAVSEVNHEASGAFQFCYQRTWGLGGTSNQTRVEYTFKRYRENSTELAGQLSISLVGKKVYSQSSPEDEPPTSAIVDNEEVASPTYEYEYNQVAANVIDSNSVVKYGERKPGTEGTLEFPLAENFDQCKGIGKKIIRDSHRLLKQPDFEVALNPLLKIGQTIAIIDKKIGYSQRWYVEEIRHTIEQGKGRTMVGCVYYA